MQREALEFEEQCQCELFLQRLPERVYSARLRKRERQAMHYEDPLLAPKHEAECEERENRAMKDEDPKNQKMELKDRLNGPNRAHKDDPIRKFVSASDKNLQL